MVIYTGRNRVILQISVGGHRAHGEETATGNDRYGCVIPKTHNVTQRGADRPYTGIRGEKGIVPERSWREKPRLPLGGASGGKSLSHKYGRVPVSPCQGQSAISMEGLG